MTTIAVVIGLTANASYYRSVMGLPVALLIVPGLTLLWRFVITTTHRVVTRFSSGWSVFAYPVLWVAVDTLMAALLPDGNWASLAYSQSENLPVMQIASLFGVGGVLFVLTLASSLIALTAARGRALRDSSGAYSVAAMILVLAAAFGVLRLQQPRGGTPTTFGLATVDDAIGIQADPSYIDGILHAYDSHVATLASQGARVVVLPEKLFVQSPRQIEARRAHFSELASLHQVWLEVGVTQDDGSAISNLAWLFEPSGALSATYQKHFLAPPERGYARGHAYETRTIDGHLYGLAICKDMHFATLGRAYAQRSVAVMLVPAWDFHADAWMGARMTAARGIEGGYTVVRSSREGFMTISDAYGHVLAESSSASLPGSTLIATVLVGPPVRTVYAAVGDVLGWSCLAAAAVLVFMIAKSAPSAAREG